MVTKPVPVRVPIYSPNCTTGGQPIWGLLRQMAIDHGLIENQNLVVVDAPGQQAHRHIGLVWRPSSSRVSTFNQLAEVVSELL